MYGNEWIFAGSWQEGNVLRLVVQYTQYTLLPTINKPCMLSCLANL